MSYPCAIHAIWTTYMTWPPGDARGHWSPLFDLYGRLIEQGHRLNTPDSVTRDRAMELAKEPPRILTDLDQSIVAKTVGDLLDREVRAEVHAAAIERTHVHLLFGPMDENIERIVGKIKGRTSSEIVRRGSEPDRRRTWTAGYWKVFLFDSRAVPMVARYIEEHNERRGLPAAPYDWIQPLA